jgi:hypothetical protein
LTLISTPARNGAASRCRDEPAIRRTALRASPSQREASWAATALGAAIRPIAQKPTVRSAALSRSRASP